MIQFKLNRENDFTELEIGGITLSATFQEKSTRGKGAKNGSDVHFVLESRPTSFAEPVINKFNTNIAGNAVIRTLITKHLPKHAELVEEYSEAEARQKKASKLNETAKSLTDGTMNLISYSWRTLLAEVTLKGLSEEQVNAVFAALTEARKVANG